MKNTLINIGRNKEIILNNFRSRVKEHRGSGSTVTLLNALNNAVNKNTKKEVNPFCLDDMGLNIFGLIQHWELIHGLCAMELLYGELPALNDEINS